MVKFPATRQNAGIEQKHR